MYEFVQLQSHVHLDSVLNLMQNMCHKRKSNSRKSPIAVSARTVRLEIPLFYLEQLNLPCREAV